MITYVTSCDEDQQGAIQVHCEDQQRYAAIATTVITE